MEIFTRLPVLTVINFIFNIIISIIGVNFSRCVCKMSPVVFVSVFFIFIINSVINLVITKNKTKSPIDDNEHISLVLHAAVFHSLTE